MELLKNQSKQALTNQQKCMDLAPTLNQIRIYFNNISIYAQLEEINLFFVINNLNKMQTSVFQQSDHSFIPCFLQKCFCPIKSQPKNSPSSSLKFSQRSGLVRKRSFDPSQRTNSQKKFLFCQTLKANKQMVTFDQNIKKSQFQRIRKKKAYQANPTSIKKINQINNLITPREEHINQRSVSKNKLSLSSRKSKARNQSNPNNRIKAHFQGVKDQLIKRNHENQQKIRVQMSNNTPILDSEFKNRLIHTASLTKNYPNTRSPPHFQSNDKTRGQSTNKNLSFYQKVGNFMSRPIECKSFEKNQVNNNQGLLSTRHGSNYNLLSSVSFRQSNKINGQSRKIDDLRKQKSQILVIHHGCLRGFNQNSNIHNLTASCEQIARDKTKANQNHQSDLVNLTQVLKPSPVQIVTENLAKQKINEVSSGFDMAYSNYHKSSSVNSFVRRSYNASPTRSNEGFQFSSYLNYPNNSKEQQNLKSFKTKTVQSIMSSNVSAGTFKVEQSAVMFNFFNPPKEIIDQLNSAKPICLLKKDSVASHYRGSGIFNQMTKSNQTSRLNQV